MNIVLKKGCEEIIELLERYSLLQERVKRHVNKISECVKCEKKGKISLEVHKNFKKLIRNKMNTIFGILDGAIVDKH